MKSKRVTKTDLTYIKVVHVDQSKADENVSNNRSEGKTCNVANLGGGGEEEYS